MHVNKQKSQHQSKLKIVLAFFQITTHLATALQFPWPTHFKNLISFFNFINVGLVQWSHVGE